MSSFLPSSALPALIALSQSPTVPRPAGTMYSCGQDPTNACGCLSLSTVARWSPHVDSLHTCFSSVTWLCDSREQHIPSVLWLTHLQCAKVLTAQGFYS